MINETQLYKGILEGCVLAVINRGESYGYKVVEALRVGGFSSISEATVYPLLNRLSKKGLLSYQMRDSNIGPPRKYYNLTKQGKIQLEEFLETWLSVKDIVEKFMRGVNDENDQ